MWRDLQRNEPRLAKEMLANNLKLHGVKFKSMSVDKGTQVGFETQLEFETQVVLGAWTMDGVKAEDMEE